MPEYIMHTKENCPFCIKAKKLFDLYEIEPIIKEGIPEDWSTFPAIYKKDKTGISLIGGFNELVEHSRKHGL